jgi:hypothetical protein
VVTSKSVVLSVAGNDFAKRLRDPANPNNLFHLETYLAFSEAAKLEQGNANVRPPRDRKPTKNMVQTVDEAPELFHLKNRGITYVCQKFEFDNAKNTITVQTPQLPRQVQDDDDFPRFGIADGGHTFDVIQRTVAQMDEYKKKPEWSEPYVRVHFLSGDQALLSQIEGVVEALNTSIQVQQYTLDEYKNKFDELKAALDKRGFNPSIIAFRENEDDKEWHILEIIQRMACFLKDRWQVTQPASMYKSKGKALDLFTDDQSRQEFRKLYDVIDDIVTLPEFIQSELSRNPAVPKRSLGKLKCVKPLKKSETRQGTKYETDHKMDLAALLPMAAAFRELLVLKGDRYAWRVDPFQAFRESIEPLYQVLVTRSGKLRTTSQLGADMEYWSACLPIVMRAKDSLIERKLANV